MIRFFGGLDIPAMLAALAEAGGVVEVTLGGTTAFGLLDREAIEILGGEMPAVVAADEIVHVLEILRHVDGVMYVEPTTGLLTIRLIRSDYDPETIPVLDADSCTLKSFARPSWGDLKDSVRVGYVSRDAGFLEKTAQAQDLAGIEIQGGEVSLQELTLRGLSNSETAQMAAARSLAALAYPLATITIEADRSAWAFRPGAVFKLIWDPLGIAGMVCRVVRVGTGWVGLMCRWPSCWRPRALLVSRLGIGRMCPMVPVDGHRRSMFHSSRRLEF